MNPANFEMNEISKNILKSNTSLVGIVCKDGIVMASDRKVTLGGQIIADKRFQKTHQIKDSGINLILGVV